MPTRPAPAADIYLDGPYRTRDAAWAACLNYARLLVARGLTPTWGVGIRPTSPGGATFAVYLASVPPGQTPPAELLSLTAPAPVG